MVSKTIKYSRCFLAMLPVLMFTAETVASENSLSAVGVFGTVGICENPGNAIKIFMDTLKDYNYIIQCGTIVARDPLDDCNDDCHGNNPSSIYGAYNLPPHPSIMADSYLVQRFMPGEAAVAIVKTPPQVHYFGLQTYLYYRKNPLAGGEYEYLDIFASIGDAFNQRTIKGMYRKYGEIENHIERFNDYAILITTADKRTESHIRAAVSQMFGGGLFGYLMMQKIVNTEMLPFDELQMGIDDDSDVFMSLLRISPYKYEENQMHYEQAQAYIENIPAVVFRITPSRARGSDLSNYFSRADVEMNLRTKPIGPQEEVYLELFANLENKILERHTAVGNPESFIPGTWVDGYRCIDRFNYYLWTGDVESMENDRWCAGDTRDTAYIVSMGVQLGTNEAAVVYGINHVKSDMATYMNVSINDVNTSKGLVAMLNYEMEKSALEYLEDTEDLYAVRVDRDCTGKSFCLEIPAEIDEAMLVIRAYLNPATAVGPAYDDIILPRYVKIINQGSE